MAEGAFRERFAVLLKERGLSQKELAAQAGISQSDLSRIEQGIANPSVATLGRIAEALGAELRISIE